jgi:hypothetical protein
MGRTIRVTAKAREAYSALDPSLQEELREHAAIIVDAPAEHVRRSQPPAEPPGLWVYEYDSRVVESLRVILLLSGLEEGAAELTLVGIAHIMHERGGDASP